MSTWRATDFPRFVFVRFSSLSPAFLNGNGRCEHQGFQGILFSSCFPHSEPHGWTGDAGVSVARDHLEAVGLISRPRLAVGLKSRPQHSTELESDQSFPELPALPEPVGDAMLPVRQPHLLRGTQRCVEGGTGDVVWKRSIIIRWNRKHFPSEFFDDNNTGNDLLPNASTSRTPLTGHMLCQACPRLVPSHR